MKRIFFLFLTLLLLPCAAAADPAPDDCGYIFRLRGECRASLSAIPEGVEALGSGLYRADSLADIQQFANGGDLLYVEPDFLVTLFDSDPLYPEQWAAALMGAGTAWDFGLDGAGVRIGLIDSGIDTSHEDLQGANIVPGWNFAEQNSDTSDSVGHGTFVAGVIAAVPDNGKGIRGIAPAAALVPLKCFSGRTTKVSYIVEALLAAVDQYDCHIINLSLGAAQSSQALADAAAHAEEQGAIVFAAVGNSGTSTLNYPAAYDTVIGVGMVDSAKTVAKNSQKNSSVFVTAPGYLVLGLDSNSGYRPGSGTSYACPHAAAAAALLKQACPGLSPAELRSMLMRTSEDLGSPGYDTSYGYGLVAVPSLLQNLPFRFSPQNGSLQISGSLFSRATVSAFAACFNAAGKMLRCDSLSVSNLPARTVSGNIPLPPDTAEVKLFFLDPSLFIPSRPPERWTP